MLAYTCQVMHNANQLWVGFQGHSTVAVDVLLESAILPCNAYAYKKKGEGEIAREVIEKKNKTKVAGSRN